ncbi:MAG: ORF6N domain-containing protein [Chitinophagales bacterium]
MKKNSSKSLLIPDEILIKKICMIRGKRVMLDRDLVELYGVETKELKRQVRRNMDRFPEDFMLELTKEEFRNWRSQIGTSNSADKMGLRYAPFAFSEQGVAMRSSVLNSKQTIAVNIRIIRVFTHIREVLLTHKDVLIKLEQLENKLGKHDHKFKKYDDEIKLIFETLKKLLYPPQPRRKRIGFRITKHRRNG